jgi:hypothetical protein
MWKESEVIVILHVNIEEIHQILRHYICCPNRNLNHATPIYKSQFVIACVNLLNPIFQETTHPNGPPPPFHNLLSPRFAGLHTECHRNPKSVKRNVPFALFHGIIIIIMHSRPTDLERDVCHKLWDTWKSPFINCCQRF